MTTNQLTNFRNKQQWTCSASFIYT